MAATTPTLAGGLTREVRPTGMAARRGARPTGRCSSPIGSGFGESLFYKMQTRLRYRRPLSLEPSNKGSTCTHNSCPTLDITTCCRSVQSPTAGATPPPRPLRKAASSSLPWAAKDADGDTLHGRPEQRKSVWQKKVRVPPYRYVWPPPFSPLPLYTGTTIAKARKTKWRASSAVMVAVVCREWVGGEFRIGKRWFRGMTDMLQGRTVKPESLSNTESLPWLRRPRNPSTSSRSPFPMISANRRSSSEL